MATPEGLQHCLGHDRIEGNPVLEAATTHQSDGLQEVHQDENDLFYAAQVWFTFCKASLKRKIHVVPNVP